MKHQLSFTLRFYECDSNGKMLFSTLLNFMQEIAASHTVELHITIPELLPRGYTWMLSRYHIVIDKYPMYGSTLSMTSWVAEHKGMFSIRDFQLKNEAGNSLARVTSSWVLYDIHKQEIAQVDKVLPIDCLIPERAVADTFPTLPVPERIDNSKQFQVRKQDLDINNHVNNRVIIEWALEAISMERIQSYELTELEITFKGQAFYGNTIVSDCQIEDYEEHFTARHHILNSDDSTTIARVRTQWRKK